MVYCILHYETSKGVHEYTLQARTQALLKDVISQAVKKLGYLGSCKIFYFNDEEKMLNFERGVFRF